MAKTQSGKTGKLFSPRLLSLAAGMAWAATNQPLRFNNLGLVGAWLVTALSIALLTCAALVLLLPILKLGGEALWHWLQQPRNQDKNGA